MHKQLLLKEVEVQLSTILSNRQDNGLLLQIEEVAGMGMVMKIK